MIKLLIISGSPVHGASVDIMLNAMADALEVELGAELPVGRTFVKLNELMYIPCQACGIAPKHSWCFFDDALTPAFEQVAACDCFLFGSPVYFDSVSGQAKMFIDRCNCFRPYDFENVDPEHDFIKRLKRKRPGAMALVGGDEKGIEGARRTVAGFFKWIEVTNEGVVTYSSPDDTRYGTVAGDLETMNRAKELGRKLAGRLRELHATQRNG